MQIDRQRAVENLAFDLNAVAYYIISGRNLASFTAFHQEINAVVGFAHLLAAILLSFCGKLA
jgi:hypothetical protein